MKAAMRRNCVTGQFQRDKRLDRVHHMFSSWANHIQLGQLSTAGQGYTVTQMSNFSGLPASAKIPAGVEFTTADDLAIENFLSQTTDLMREYVKIKYLQGRILSKYKHAQLLKTAANWLYS